MTGRRIIKIVFAFGGVTVLLAGVLLTGMKIGQLPVTVFELGNSDPYLVNWRRDWRSAPNQLVSATVVGNAPDQLFLYIDTVYTGDHGPATTCGGVSGGHAGGVWTCSPTSMNERRGFTMLRFGLNSRARDIECSDSITIDMYDRNGSTFYQETVPYKKVWVKQGSGALGKLRELFSICPA